jgi:hypothetical protein
MIVISSTIPGTVTIPKIREQLSWENTEAIMEWNLENKFSLQNSRNSHHWDLKNCSLVKELDQAAQVRLRNC